VTPLEEMLNELESHMLVTILAPSKRRDRQEHDQIRVNMDENPRWYRKLCANHPSSREVRRGKFDTRIKRANVLSTLRTLVKRGHSPSKYVDELTRIAKQRGN
jgi:hypothetical protein